MKKLPIKLKPIQVRSSLYILVPKTITQLFNISENTTFILSVKEHENKSILVFRTQRSNGIKLDQKLEEEHQNKRRDLI